MFWKHTNHSAQLLALLVLSASNSLATQPTVTIYYSPRLDWVCSVFRGPSIEASWEAELLARRAEFEKLWLNAEASMLAAVGEITGHAFPEQSVAAWLTLCDLPSQSLFGVSVNMRYALRSFTPNPVPLQYKVGTLFHELLHGFLEVYPVRNSQQLEVYASESAGVRKHLHLLALQKAVFLKLGKSKELDTIIAIDSHLPSNAYKRAWQIVNSTNSEYLKFIAELTR